MLSKVVPPEFSFAAILLSLSTQSVYHVIAPRLNARHVNLLTENIARLVASGVDNIPSSLKDSVGIFLLQNSLINVGPPLPDRVHKTTMCPTRTVPFPDHSSNGRVNLYAIGAVACVAMGMTTLVIMKSARGLILLSSPTPESSSLGRSLHSGDGSHNGDGPLPPPNGSPNEANGDANGSETSIDSESGDSGSPSSSPPPISEGGEGSNTVVGNNGYEDIKHNVACNPEDPPPPPPSSTVAGDEEPEPYKPRGFSMHNYLTLILYSCAASTVYGFFKHFKRSLRLNMNKTAAAKLLVNAPTSPNIPFPLPYEAGPLIQAFDAPTCPNVPFPLYHPGEPVDAMADTFLEETIATAVTTCPELHTSPIPWIVEHVVAALSICPTIIPLVTDAQVQEALVLVLKEVLQQTNPTVPLNVVAPEVDIMAWISFLFPRLLVFLGILVNILCLFPLGSDPVVYVRPGHAQKVAPVQVSKPQGIKLEVPSRHRTSHSGRSSSDSDASRHRHRSHREVEERNSRDHQRKKVGDTTMAWKNAAAEVREGGLEVMYAIDH